MEVPESQRFLQKKRGVYLACITILLAALGNDRYTGSDPDTRAASRRIDETMEELLAPSAESAVDPQGLVDEKVFTFLLRHEVHKATRLQYYLSVLCLTPDLPPREVTLGALTNQLGRIATRHLRASDVASVLSPSCLAFLLVDAEIQNLKGIFHRLKEAFGPSHFTFSAGGACYPQTSTKEGDLMKQAADLMTRARADGGNRLYLARS